MDNQIEINHVKLIRTDLDGLSELIMSITDNGIRSDQTVKSKDSILLAKAWLGKVLESLNEPSPYKNDGRRKTISDIEPTAERTYTNYSEHLKINWQEIKKITGEVGSKTYEDIYQHNIFTHLSEARFWLGFELQRLREENPVKG